MRGVKIADLPHHVIENGYFLEIVRLQKNALVQNFPKFQVQQISYSTIDPGIVKAWHLHAKQNDLWFIPQESQLLVGLADLRSESTTKGNIIKQPLGKAGASLVLIPKGVAHGYKNFSNKKSSIIYLADFTYNPKNPDEYRLPWDILGKNFWAGN
ncbi:hypothetical protein A3A49_00650 [Candidatus Curtissbacteria bacterium RIFCSPLOWO2_01_FULL_38_11b]|uniref:Spore coat protein n=1 Tax=Candidatus Curtissbacteria bacterium RIFCSPLOWO2_01_FULL_38_11b TaxID=1797725 RepID=A0A1F5H3S6_9BACT|nr:MAG: hypothetical protein A3A49_00650 [Candidatus Curtissbacteria bacterium RIFCSPLOWO2_01_FULL_38_11b]